MAREKIIIGLDVGTCNVTVAVAQIKEGNPATPQILGVGRVVSGGLRKGVVVDIEETVKNIKEAAAIASRISGVPVDAAYLSIGGSHITCRASKGVVAVSRADGEISREDKERVINASSAISLSPNREILHVLPRRFCVDNQDSIKEPVGMQGVRLEVDALIVEGATPYIKNLSKCVKEADVYAQGMLLAPLAASRAVLTKRQKELGVLLLDLGGGTSGMAVYEEGDIISCQIIPLGSMHVTNDIAIGLRTSIDVAEKVKLEYGSVLPSQINKKEMVNLAKAGGEEGQISRHHIAEIIEARVSETLDLVNKELKKIDRAGLLPAGVVLVGGGAKLLGLVELAKEKLKLPVHVGRPQNLEGIVDQVDDPSFATVCGLILSVLSDENIKETGDSMMSAKAVLNRAKRWFKSFLP
ncbi:cell division protein FtsA [Patescibacteria group bacterium]|nr:cell division protein FtsA [Patescibacteria group bacterium]